MMKDKAQKVMNSVRNIVTRDKKEKNDIKNMR